MGRANIDLSWLVGLLTKTPTAEQNPTFGASQEQPFFDSQTGTYSSEPAYTDAQGNEIPGTLGKADTIHQLVPPSQWQRFVHPEQAGQIDTVNNAFVTKPLMAGLENKVNIDTRAGNVLKMNPALRPPTLTPEQAAVSGYGDFSPPTITNQYNRAVTGAEGGLPTTMGQTDVVQAGTGLKASLGEAGRQDVQESVLDQDTLNHWFKSFHLTPMESQLAEKQLKTEMGVQPLVAQIRERALQNQLKEQTDLVPAQTQLSLTQTQNAQRGASEAGNLWPYTKTSMDNRAIGDAATSFAIPEQPRFANMIQPDKSVAPFRKDPLGASPFAIQMSSLGDLKNASGGDIIKDSSGKSYTIPKAPPSNMDPLTGQPLITSTNGPSISHDTSGSMAPPVSDGLSHTTLGTGKVDQMSPDEIHNEMAKVEAQYYQYPNSDAGMRYQMLKKMLQSITPSMHKPLSHISMNPAGLNIP